VTRAAALDRLRSFHAEWTPPVTGFCERVRHVVLIVCSSRGGSSVFTEMLRHHAGMIHLPGEINPLLSMAGLTHPDSGTDSDALSAAHVTDTTAAILSRAFAHQAGRPDRVPDAARLTRDLVWRLTAQWPDVAFSEARVATCVDAALGDLVEGGAIQSNYVRLIQAIRRAYPEVNPWYADLDPVLVSTQFPDVAEPRGPASSSVIEEAPFVLTQPWRPVTEADLDTQPLVFKTPSNAYRLPFLRALFPHARVQLLHLTRNPAAAINGLVDGWRFRGFHAHRMDSPLALDVDGHPDDAHWWKYDLPPGWRAWTDKRLAEIAGFQWSAAHSAVLDHTATHPIDTFRLRFEDVVGPVEVRERRVGALLEWIGVDPDPEMRRVIHEGLPPVMATARPRQRRWFARAALLDPVLRRDDVAKTAERLGYTDRSLWT
jgi:hypothetical protein